MVNQKAAMFPDESAGHLCVLRQICHPNRVVGLRSAVWSLQHRLCPCLHTDAMTQEDVASVARVLQTSSTRQGTVQPEHQQYGVWPVSQDGPLKVVGQVGNTTAGDSRAYDDVASPLQLPLDAFDKCSA